MKKILLYLIIIFSFGFVGCTIQRQSKVYLSDDFLTSDSKPTKSIYNIQDVDYSVIDTTNTTQKTSSLYDELSSEKSYEDNINITYYPNYSFFINP